MVCCDKQGDIHKINFLFDVYVQKYMVLEQHMSLRVFDTKLGGQGMKGICEI